MMSAKMRRVGAHDGKGHCCVVVREIPELGRGMLLVRVRASLISPGTELVSFKNLRKNPPGGEQEPKPFGYQNAGVVEGIGENVSGFKKGDRVACMGGGYALHADYAVVPQNLCALLPDNVSFEEGAFAHLAITSLHAVRRGAPQLGEYMLVAGLGLVGLMAARLGQLSGAYVMGWDTIDFRIKSAVGFGIDGAVLAGSDEAVEKSRAFTSGAGFDMSVLAFGGEGTESLEIIKSVMKVSPDGHNMGRICLVGGLRTSMVWGAGMGNLDLLSCARTGPGYHDNAWELGECGYPGVFVRWNTKSSMDFVLRLISEGKLDVSGLISHKMPLSKIDDAVTMHIEQQDKTMGTVLMMDEDGG